MSQGTHSRLKAAALLAVAGIALAGYGIKLRSEAVPTSGPAEEIRLRDLLKREQGEPTVSYSRRGEGRRTWGWST